MSKPGISENQASQLAIVALGSNIGESRLILEQAITRLEEFSDHELLQASLWRSTPVDCPPGSPTFWNTVVAFLPRATETPESLLVHLQQMEKEFGRKPKQVLNEPRPLDLDILVFGQEIRRTPELTLPHPRAHSRRFVLQPLAEILPDLIWPGQSKSVATLLRELNTVEVLHRV